MIGDLCRYPLGATGAFRPFAYSIAAAILGVAALALLGVQPLAHAAPPTIAQATTSTAQDASDAESDLAPVLRTGEGARGLLRHAHDGPVGQDAAELVRGSRGAWVRRTFRAPTACPQAEAPARPSRSSTPTTTPTPRWTWPFTAASMASCPAPAPTAVSRRWTSAAAPTTRPPMTGREIALDLDMVSAAAPGADILLVETDNDGLENLAAGVDEAVALGAKYVSTDGRSGDFPTDLATYGSSYDHPGVAVVAASGDNKYGVSFPATLPSVTAVGGTTLTADPTSARGWSETVWTRGSYGPGSGCASNQTKPDFQQDTGCTGRSVADVSAVADNVAVYLTYGSQGIGWQRYGGTSVATPVIASLYALAGPPRPGTSPNSYPYAADGVGLNDITTGSNGTCSVAYLCNAGTGYDGPTGLGTPAGLAAFRAAARHPLRDGQGLGHRQAGRPRDRRVRAGHRHDRHAGGVHARPTGGHGQGLDREGLRLHDGHTGHPLHLGRPDPHPRLRTLRHPPRSASTAPSRTGRDTAGRSTPDSP